MNGQQLAAIAGVILSLALSYVPRLREKFDALDSTHKRALTGLLIVAVALVTFGASCAPQVAPLVQTACSANGLIEIVNNVIAALVASQATYLLTPPKPSVP